MNHSKLAKLGIISFSTLTLGVVAPVVVPVAFGGNVIYAEEQTATYRVHYVISGEGTDIIPPKENSLKPGESVVETAIEIPGYTVDENDSPSSIDVNYDIITSKEWSVFFGKDPDGIARTGFGYKKVETPADQPTTPVKPETSTNKPTTGRVIRYGNEELPSEDETSLKYTIKWYYSDPNDGVGWVAEQTPHINAGDTHEVEGQGERTKPWTPYRIMEGTPESYTITYDDVKAGKTHYVFRLYNTKTHNPDGTPKTAEQPAPTENPTDKPEAKLENKVEPKTKTKPAQQTGTAASNATIPAPTADAKAPTIAQIADKPADKKKETLPNTGENTSPLSLLGVALATLGLAELSYRGRHERKR